MTRGNARTSEGASRRMCFVQQRLRVPLGHAHYGKRATGSWRPLGRHHLPLKVSRLRSKLSQKAKQEPKFRFYALYDRIYRLDVLQAAGVKFESQRLPPVWTVSRLATSKPPTGRAGFSEASSRGSSDKRYKPDAVRRVKSPSLMAASGP